jgi:hypothetical protein
MRLQPSALFLFALPGIALADPADCPATSNNQDISALLDTADSALDGADVEAFRKTIDRVAMDLPCMSEPISTSSAARLHALQGIQQYVSGEHEPAKASFLAARTLNSAVALPGGLFPEGHEIHSAFSAGDVDAIQSLKVPGPKGQELYIDGLATREKPLDRPFIGQLADADGIAQTRYLGVGDAVIDYSVNPFTRLTSNGDRAKRLHLSLGAAALAGAVYGYQWKHFLDFKAIDDHFLDSEEAKGYQTKNYALLGSSSALALVSVGIAFGARNAADE